jgi:hypothetical protein
MVTLGEKFFGLLVSILLTGFVFDMGWLFLGCAFLSVDVLLLGACLLHYLDKGLAK